MSSILINLRLIFIELRSVSGDVNNYNGNTSQIEVPAIRQTKPGKLASYNRHAVKASLNFALDAD